VLKDQKGAIPLSRGRSKIIAERLTARSSRGQSNNFSKSTRTKGRPHHRDTRLGWGQRHGVKHDEHGGRVSARKKGSFLARGEKVWLGGIVSIREKPPPQRPAADKLEKRRKQSGRTLAENKQRDGGDWTKTHFSGKKDILGNSE